MPQEKIKILLVEDDVAHVELVRRSFESHSRDYHLSVANCLQEARDYLKDPFPNLLIADLVLPDGKGMELLSGQDNHRFPVVMMTSHGDEQKAVEAMRAGALDYIVKSEETLADMPRIAERALREWEHYTERLKAEAALKESEEKYRSMMEAMSDLAYICSPDYRVSYMNPAMITKIGRDATGDRCHRVIQRLKEKCPWCPYNIIQNGEHTETEMVGPWDGQFYHVTHSPIFHLDGTVSKLTIFRDITDRRRTEEELKQANRKILEQQKAVVEEERLKVLLQMAGATAHELNQPLMALLGNIELMMIEKKNPQKTAQYLTEVYKAGRRISDIVKNIQTIRHDEIKPYLRDFSIINIDQKINILFVEDSDDDFSRINAILKDQGKINFFRATTLAEAVEKLKKGPFDLIFLDYYLPDGNGLEFLKRTMKNGLKTPIVVITGKGDEMTAAQVIKVGAYDYLAKDRVSNKSLSRIITNTLDKAQLHREVEQAQKKLAELSTRDELTGLYNRRFFDEALEREIARARRYGSDLVLCMLDLDHFKKVNDTYGHAAGDSVLSEVSKMLKNCIRKSDFVGRYGGEEFAILLPNTGPEQARIVSEKFRRMVAGHHFRHNGSRFQLTVSLGIAAYNRISDPSSDQLVEFADQALYRAKREGRNRVFFFPMGQIETPAHV